MNHPELVHGLELLPCAIRDGMLYIPHADGNWVSAAKLQPFSLAIIDCWRAEQPSAALPTTLKAAPEAVPVDEVAIRLRALEDAARACEKLAEERFDDHGTREPDTGACYYGGRVEEEYQARDEEDADCAAAIRALAAKHDTAPQALKAGDAPYPLPDSLYPGSKDWLAGTYGERVEWLHTMYEGAKQERDELLNAAGDAPETVSEDARMLDFMEERRVSVAPEFEGCWDATVYGDDSEPQFITSGNTPREAIRAAMSAAGDAPEWKGQCPRCKGEGAIPDRRTGFQCPECAGNGWVPDEAGDAPEVAASPVGQGEKP